MLSLQAAASHDNTTAGGRSAAMGNSSVTLCDFWAVSNNQAGLANYKNPAGGIYYENRFLMKELSLKSGAVIVPTNSGVFGVNLSYFGYSLYNEKKAGLAYGKALSKNLSAGIQLDYLSTHIAENYGKRDLVTFEAGVIYMFNKNFGIGAHIFNPIRVKLADYDDERIPTILCAGLSYKFSEKVFACIETEKNINYSPSVKAGLEYHVVKELYLRTGIKTNPISNTFGFGLELGNLKFDFATGIHQVLGYTPQLSLIYTFNNTKPE